MHGYTGAHLVLSPFECCVVEVGSSNPPNTHNFRPY